MASPLCCPLWGESIVHSFWAFWRFDSKFSGIRHSLSLRPTLLIRNNNMSMLLRHLGFLTGIGPQTRHCRLWLLLPRSTLLPRQDIALLTILSSTIPSTHAPLAMDFLRLILLGLLLWVILPMIQGLCSDFYRSSHNTCPLSGGLIPQTKVETPRLLRSYNKNLLCMCPEDMLDISSW